MIVPPALCCIIKTERTKDTDQEKKKRSYKMKKNLTDLYVADYTSLYREDEDDYSYIYEKGRYESSFRSLNDFDESRFSFDCLMVA